MDQFSADDVLQLLSIPFRDRKNTEVPCPLCGKKKFFFNREKNKGHCFHCGFRGNATSFYAESRGISTKEAYKEILQELDLWNDKNTSNKPDKKKKKVIHKTPVFPKESPIADIETRDRIYREFLSRLTLSEKHRVDLMERGLTEKEIEMIGYKSYSLKSAIAAMKSMVKDGLDFTGVPGFYTENGNWRVVKMKDGIIIPYLDINRKLQGFQIRKDNELINSKDEAKCLWFSSDGRENGTKMPATYHISADWTFGCNGLTFKHNGSIYLTEGGMKGDIAHAISRSPFISVPGVNALGELEKLLQSGILQSMGINTIYVAYDMDFLTNEQVKKAFDKLCKMLELYGFYHEQSTWSTKNSVNGKPLKGIDDYLAFHRRGICPR